MEEMQEKVMCCGECEGRPGDCGHVEGKARYGDCEYVEGNVSKSIDVDKNSKACEIRVDIEVERRRTIRLWGQIRDCQGKPVKCAMVKLVREVIEHGKKRYEGIAHGITDCLGFYQFDICVPEHCQVEKFRVFVSKQAIGEEIVVEGAECDPCHDSCECAK